MYACVCVSLCVCIRSPRYALRVAPRECGDSAAGECAGESFSQALWVQIDDSKYVCVRVRVCLCKYIYTHTSDMMMYVCVCIYI